MRGPRIYFKEWGEPMISGVGWVPELIHIADGADCFPELAGAQAARDRVIVDPAQVVQRAPDQIIGSWCGKRLRPGQVARRAGWVGILASRTGQVFQIKSPDILSPGPAALTDGLRQPHARIGACAQALAAQS